MALKTWMDLRHVVEDDALGGVGDAVDDAIKLVGELVDVFAVERGDEGLVEGAQDLASEDVPAMAFFFDFGGGLVIAVDAIEELAQALNCGEDELGKCLKLVIEAEVFGHEVEDHGRYLSGRLAANLSEVGKRGLDVSRTNWVEPVTKWCVPGEFGHPGVGNDDHWKSGRPGKPIHFC